MSNLWGYILNKKYKFNIKNNLYIENNFTRKYILDNRSKFHTYPKI